MPWTEPAYVATGDIMTASQWNNQVVDNLQYIADKVGRGAGVHVGTSVDPGAGHLLVAGIVSWLGQSMAVWRSAGTHSWTVPGGVYRVRAIVTGGGGGGGADATCQAVGGGGGAGATAFAVFNVTPGESLTIVVGNGGTGGSGGAGGSGQPSRILRGSTVLVEAAGGSGGSFINCADCGVPGGAGGNSATFGAGVTGFFIPGGTGFGGAGRIHQIYTEGYGGVSFWGIGSPNTYNPGTGAPGGGGGGGVCGGGRPGQPGIVVIFY
jgi:hypothetical protein